jgi:HK97 family phage prohead protease
MAFKKTFVLSDETVNSYGFVVKTSGIRLDNGRKNLPCFYDHKTWEVPLGHWENLRVENNRLLGDLIINGDNDREKNYINKIENGDIKGASIGADPIVWNDDKMQLQAGQTRPTLQECDLFEASITPLPGNTAALALKHEGNLVTLSANNQSIIPLLKQESDMKAIALKLGLDEKATENDILNAIGAVQLAKTNAEALNATVLAEAQKDLTDDQKAIFVTLSKADPVQALAYVKLSKPVSSEAAGMAGASNQPGSNKAATIANLIQLGKQTGGEAASSDGKDSFDYLQKHNKVELARIKKEEPEKYAKLCDDYANGLRYTSK